jgi:hypothetical protein
MKTEDKFQLLIVRTKYLKSTLKLTKQTADMAHKLFVKYLNEHLGKEQPPEPEKEKTVISAEPTAEHQHRPNAAPSHDASESEEITKIVKEQKDGNLKLGFRKIASKIHPDKLLNKSDFERNYMNALFEKARKSFAKNDYYGIIEVAEELDIEMPPPTQKQIELMKETNKKLEKEIDTLQRSVVWGWHHADDAKKQSIMEKYIAHLEKSNTRT